MTPARQPQHCDHECVCRLWQKWMRMREHDKPCNWKACDHDTRTHTSAPAPEPDEIRPEVIAFAKVMEDTLRKHDGKKTHWRDVSVSFGYLFGRVSDEIREAKDEYHVHNPDYHKCVMELVDVANFCMMCYDRIHPADTRSRPHTSAPAPEPDGCSFRVAKMDAMYDNGYAEGAKAASEQALGLARDMYGLMMCVEKANTDEFMEYYAERMRGLKEQYESLRQQEPQQ